MPKIEKTYTVFKGIKLTEAQAANWNPQKVKDFLDGKVGNSQHLKMGRRLYEIMSNYTKITDDIPDDDIDFLEEFKEVFSIE